MDEMRRNETTLRSVLGNAAYEVGHIGKLASQVEHSLFEWLKANVPTSTAPTSLQDLDLLIQKLEELSSFIVRVSETVDEDISIASDAIISPIKLASLRASLLSKSRELLEVDEFETREQVEFF